MAILEMAEEVCNEEATKHQAHGQQGSVGEGPFKQLVNGLIAFWMWHDFLYDRVEGVLHRVVHMFIVQNKRVGVEDLRGEVKGSKVRQKKKKRQLATGVWRLRWEMDEEMR